MSKERLEALAARTDDQIDYSDIPQLDDAFWATAIVVEPKQQGPADPRHKAEDDDGYVLPT